METEFSGVSHKVLTSYSKKLVENHSYPRTTYIEVILPVKPPQASEMLPEAKTTQ